MEITLTRTSRWPRKATCGQLRWPTGDCFTLEDALILNPSAFNLVATTTSGSGIHYATNPGSDGFLSSKIPGLTAIPAGRYRLISRHSTRFNRKLPALVDVPGFSDILIHAGNTVANTEGCILLGTAVVEGQILTYSLKALERFMVWFAPAVRSERIYLTVTNP